MQKTLIFKTDHRPIVDKFCCNTSATSLHQKRYFDYIAQRTNKVQHVEGIFNVADTLSRLPKRSESDIHTILPEEPSLNYPYIAISLRGESEIERLCQGESIDAPFFFWKGSTFSNAGSDGTQPASCVDIQNRQYTYSCGCPMYGACQNDVFCGLFCSVTLAS